MNYKMEKMIKNNKKYLIVFLIIWLLAGILLIAPLSVAIANNVKADSGMDLSGCITDFMNELAQFTAITKIFASNIIGIYMKAMFYMTVILAVFFIIGTFKSRSKNEFTDIEHGSSDWSEGGEQYRILNKKNGIILAENNYLPTDKLGNVNVLVVGRFRIW